MIIPAKRLFVLLGLMALLTLLVILYPQWTESWWLFLLIASFPVLLDAGLLLKPLGLKVQRKVGHSLAQGVWQDIEIKLTSSHPESLTLDVFDHFPPDFNFRHLPQKTTLPPGQFVIIRYPVQPLQRGQKWFQQTQLRRLSPLGFFQRNYPLGNSSLCRVYPDFSAVSQYALLARDRRSGQLGIVKKRRRGQGQDFHQLREYHPGDPLRQIDWNASARLRKLISREYQDERDQEIIFLIDCSHRMRTHDEGTLSHFDHALNAVLLLSHVALHQGDAVGLSTFSGKHRWQKPMKGIRTLKNILNLIYDLEPVQQPPDYSTGATQLLARHKKRALVIIITNIRDEDSSDLLSALRLLKKRHLVVLASLQEQALNTAIAHPIQRHEDALRVAATHHYLSQRKLAFDTLNASGTLCLDSTPQNLPVALVNHYFEIKAAGKL